MKSTANAIKPDFSKRLTLCYTSTYGVKEAYDSSGDYWKVIKDKDGKVTGVIDDQNYETITYVDESGKTLEEEAVRGSLSQQIADSTRQTQTKGEINQIMIDSGLSHSGKPGTRWFVADANKQQVLQTGISSLAIGQVKTNQGFFGGLASKWDSLKGAAANMYGKTTNWISEKLNDVTNRISSSDSNVNNKQLNNFNEAIERTSWFNLGSPNCDRYVTEVLDAGSMKPDNWPDPAETKVAKTSANEKNTYLDVFSGSLQNKPSYGWNAMLMTGGKFPESPHMALIFLNRGEKPEYDTIFLTHYTDSKINTSSGWTLKSLEKAFKYDSFRYLPISERY